MKYYKEFLLTKLTNSGWELIEEDHDADWWLESSWLIKSIQDSYGYELYLLFLVDPQYDGNKKESAVWAIAAFKCVPSERPMSGEIASMDLVKGKFDQKISRFVNEIDKHRNEALK